MEEVFAGGSIGGGRKPLRGETAGDGDFGVDAGHVDVTAAQVALDRAEAGQRADREAHIGGVGGKPTCGVETG